MLRANHRKRWDAKPTGLTFFKEIKPAGLPEDLGLAVIGKKMTDGPA